LQNFWSDLSIIDNELRSYSCDQHHKPYRSRWSLFDSRKKNFSRNPCGPPQGWRRSKNLFIFSRKLSMLFCLGSSSNFSQMNFFMNEQHWKVPEVVFLEAVYPMTLNVTLISPQAETFSSNIYIWKDAVFHGLSPGIKTFW
jgi:hypothetical protein